MSLCILIIPKANQDLDDLFDYIAQNNSDAGLRFFDAARKTIAKLAQNAGMGNSYLVNNSRLQACVKVV